MSVKILRKNKTLKDMNYLKNSNNSFTNQTKKDPIRKI
jgi:hypothetical protein